MASCINFIKQDLNEFKIFINDKKVLVKTYWSIKKLKMKIANQFGINADDYKQYGLWQYRQRYHKPKDEGLYIWMERMGSN